MPLNKGIHKTIENIFKRPKKGP